MSKENILFMLKVAAMLLTLYGSFMGGKENQKLISNEHLKSLGQVIQILSGECKP